MKTCCHCLILLPYSEYYSYSYLRTSDGYEPYCKNCHIEYAKEWYQDNKERLLAEARDKWVNDIQYRERLLERKRRYREANREKIRERQRVYDAKRNRHAKAEGGV